MPVKRDATSRLLPGTWAAPSPAPATEDPLARATEHVERLCRVWRASTYLWPTRTRATGRRAARVPGTLPVRPCSSSDRLAQLWVGLARLEEFSRVAVQLAATMRRLGLTARAARYQRRAEQTRARVALLSSLLITLELAYGSIGSLRGELARRNGAELPQQAPPNRVVALPTRPSGRRRRASDELTARECEVAALIVRGYTNRQIAEELVISPGTAANHVAHILAKLGCDNRAHAIAWLVQRGSLEEEEALAASR
jgi:DNA-binding CsgD family transcriptional regulator